jgi:hypothetical protein
MQTRVVMKYIRLMLLIDFSVFSALLLYKSIVASIQRERVSSTWRRRYFVFLNDDISAVPWYVDSQVEVSGAVDG